MLLILNALLIIFTIHCLLSLIGIRRVVDYFLAMTLGFTAETFLITEFLSLFHLFAPLPFFIAEILLLSLVVFFWNRKGRPAAISLDDIRRLWHDAKVFFIDYRRNWPFFILILLAGVILATRALNTVLNFNNNLDMVNYHHPKIALWFQHGSIFFSQEQARFVVDKRLVGSPPVYEVLCAYFVLWTKTLRGVGVVEIGGALAAVLAIYGITRQFTSRRGAFISALVFLSFPVVVYDLARPDATITSLSFFLIGFYFFQRAEREAFHRTWIALSSLSYVLAFMSKPTIYLLVPTAIAAIFFSVLVLKTEKRWAVLRDWAVIAVLAFILFGAGITIQNTVLFHDPFLLNNWNQYPTSESFNKEGCLVTNLARYTYNRMSPDFSPHFIQEAAMSRYAAFWRQIHEQLGLDVTSRNCIKKPFTYRVGWPGLNITGFLLLVVSLFSSFKKVPGERFNRLWIMLFWVIQVLLFSLSRVYTPTTFRYFASSAAFLAILSGDFFERISSKKLVLLLVTGLLFYKGVIDTGLYHLGRYGNKAISDATFGDDGNERDRQAILHALIPAGSSIVVSVQDVLITDVAYWGPSFENEVIFSDCANLYDTMTAHQPDFLVYSGKYDPDINRWDLDYCLGQYASAEGNRLDDLLAGSYRSVYQGWYSKNIYAIILQRNDGIPLFSEYPPARPVIFIDESLRDVVGGGPFAYFTRDIGLASEEFLFGLTARGPQQDIPVHISLTGSACAPDGAVWIVVYDPILQVMLNEPFQLVEGGISFTTDLGDGPNRVFIDERGCDEDVTPPLRINQITVGPLSD